MGGGKRSFQEVRKARQLAPALGSYEADAGGSRSSEAPEAQGLREPLCEREQTVSFRLFDGAKLALGDAVAVLLGSPPTVATATARVGELTDARQSETLLACIEADYSIFGEVIAIDTDLREGLATVAGVRTRE